MSFIEILLDTEAKGLPQESVAVQVSIIKPLHEPLEWVANVDGLETPLIKHPPLNPFVNGSVEGAGNVPQDNVRSAGAVIVGKAAGLTVIVLETGANALPQESVAVHVSVTVPPQESGVTVNVDRLEVPLIKHPPLNPLVNERVDGAGNDPQATVIVLGAVIVGNSAGLTVIVLETGAKALPQESVAVHVSVTIPPQEPGGVENVDGLEVPLIKHPPLNPFVKERVDGAGNEPQATVILEGAVIVATAAGLTVIVLDFVIVLPKRSVNDQDSIIVPPQAGEAGLVEVCALNVEVTLPLIKQAPDAPLV